MKSTVLYIVALIISAFIGLDVIASAFIVTDKTAIGATNYAELTTTIGIPYHIQLIIIGVSVIFLVAGIIKSNAEARSIV